LQRETWSLRVARETIVERAELTGVSSEMMMATSRVNRAGSKTWPLPLSRGPWAWGWAAVALARLTGGDEGWGTLFSEIGP